MTDAGTDDIGSGRRPRVRGRKRGIALLLVAVLVAGASVAASQLTDPAAMTAAPTPEPVTAATSGTAYCPAVAGEGDTAQLEIASASATEPSEITVTRYVDGQPISDAPRQLAAGTSEVLEIPDAQRAVPFAIEWRGGPVVAQHAIADDTERALATCATQPSDRWYLAGFDTNRGNTSTLHLFNPFGSDAVVQLRFGTLEGPVDLVIADELTVPAGEVVSRDLAEFRPETADLAVSVVARSGRVVPQGEVVRGPAGEGLEAITGRALVPASPTPGPTLLLPEALVDDVTESWVTVYNPADRHAAVEVQVSTPLGTASTLASELTVPAGGTARIDLADLSALPRMGVRLESVNGIGLVASRTSAVRDGERTGVTITPAVGTADEEWVVPGAVGTDAVLTVFNPGTAVATATVEVAGDPVDGADGIEVPPNALVEVPLGDVEGGGAALVTADLPVVAGVVSLGEGAAATYWSATGVPLSELIGGGQALPPRRDPSLSSRPAVSATATPTPTPVPDRGGEGQLDATPTPTIIGPPSETPTPSPGAVPPAETTEPATTEPAPTETGTGQPGPDPGGPDAAPTTTEDSLFG
ncbi:DUF5719 family protein [Euzebya sp.]|uniref:DUF5719 family protein n=1 Tax=Euzebya sp. TaxID=1971409 RepID=UPI0035114077